MQVNTRRILLTASMPLRMYGIGITFLLGFVTFAGCETLQAKETPVKITRASAPSPSAVQLTLVADDFFRPLLLTHAGDNSGRLFIVEQTGKIWIMKDGARLAAPFLDVSDLIAEGASGPKVNEGGLLGLAFHPDYPSNGSFFINYTDRSPGHGNTVIERLQVSADNPDLALVNSRQLIMHVEQPTQNHNGGHLAFGPDGYLYIGMGDGGTRKDIMGAGQNRQLLLGKILRIDVDSAAPYAIPPDNPFVGESAARDEIWSYGLRNPWRFSFDRLTGDMYLGDVGSRAWEEVNFQSADSLGGENYGWNFWEGNDNFSGEEAPNHVPPFFVYGHNHGCAVNGGYLYRGEKIADLQAVYVFGDFCSARIWASWRESENKKWRVIEFIKKEGIRITSFGEDEAGEIYVLDYGGKIYRFDPADA